MALLLEAVDVAGPWRWRWLLTHEDGTPLADHWVDLDPGSDDVTRFCHLYEYVRLHSAPDRRTADESRFVSAAGAWAGRELLGERIGAAIAAEAPVTVRVAAPTPAESVLLWPLELAHVDGRPLAARGDVPLVQDIAPDSPARRKDGVAGALRMLAVFSQPTETSVLALRRERYALSQLIRRIAARERAAVELRVVQYGVTRERLAEIADSGDGWDVLHLSGHGGGGLFLLEHADGSPDLVSTADLIGLLRRARRRVKLAVVSACQSAADTTAEALRLLGLTDQAEALETESAAQPAARVPGLARALVRELDCAVVAMRYPVTDEFAIAFGDVFYEHLLSRGHPVDVAVARALAEAAGSEPSAARPAMSLATPAIFGSRAAGLTLTVPRGRPQIDPAGKKMAYFDPPGEPKRFVGRAEAMAKASAALASHSGKTAVLLHGMAGAGKTACALELAYRHQDGFAALAFWQAPTRDDEWAGALASLANRLDIQLGDYGFTMAGHIGTTAALEKFLPRLRQVMKDSGILLVLDNLETLLTPEGRWRDPRWEPLTGALTGHDGESRVILTSRIAPADLDASVVTLPVHALSRDEAVALARELPNLRALLHADGGPGRAGASADADRERVRRVLRLVQGHPKMLELADAAAADTGRLDTQLTAAEQAAAGKQLEAFFRDGTSTLDPEQFLDALTAWTTTALTVLSSDARLMAEFLACLEDGDRQANIIDANWGNLWRRLERSGDPSGLGPLLDLLAAAALIAAEHGDAGAPVTYRMHPGVAAAIAAAAGPDVRDATDTELGAFWLAVAKQAMEREGGEHTGLIVHAGLAATPYLLRGGNWNIVGALLGDVITVGDGAPDVVQTALPVLRHIAETTGTPHDRFYLARALITVDPAEAERLLRDTLRAATGGNDYRFAAAIAGNLVDLARNAGRLSEALELTGQKADYTRRAGLGPWTELADQGQRLQILALMGAHEQVLAETPELLARMAQLPDHRVRDEAVSPWIVREGILSSGFISAQELGAWQQCLDFSAGIHASQRQRGAGEYEIARFRIDAAGPLIRLGRMGEAERLLQTCQQVFEDHADTTMLARVASIRASREIQLGNWQSAADFVRTALRLHYVRFEVREIALNHFNLAQSLRRADDDRAGQRAHRLAAALIFQLTSMMHNLAETQRALAGELREGRDAEQLPATLAEVIEAAERTEGVRLGELITALEPDTQSVAGTLAQVLGTAATGLPLEENQWRQLADAGDTNAMANVGALFYERGEISDAERWWRQAAEAGHTTAMASLGGLLYAQGNDSEAERWCRKAAIAGNSSGMNNLGNLLQQQGKLSEARRWYSMAADAGAVDAMRNLGDLLRKQGKDGEAEAWYRRATDAGDFGAMWRLGLLLREQGNDSEAETLWRQAAEAGDADAMCNLGVLLQERGRTDEAERWWRNAASNGNGRAMQLLSKLLQERGETGEAERWGRRADAYIQQLPHERTTEVEQVWRQKLRPGTSKPWPTSARSSNSRAGLGKPNNCGAGPPRLESPKPCTTWGIFSTLGARSARRNAGGAGPLRQATPPPCPTSA